MKAHELGEDMQDKGRERSGVQGPGANPAESPRLLPLRLRCDSSDGR